MSDLPRVAQGNWPRIEVTDDADDLLSRRPGGIVRTRHFAGGWTLSDLPKDLPEPERVIPLPDQTEPEDAEDAEDEAELPIDTSNAQLEGGDLTGSEAG